MTLFLPFGYMRDHPLENMAATDETAIAEPGVEAWTRNNVLQHHSRAFGFLALGDNASGRDVGFFVPSYLERSTYVQALKVAHQTNVMARNDTKPPVDTDFQNDLDFPAVISLPAGSHRGMAHSIVERSPPSAEEDALPPLPTSWNRDDMWSGLEIAPDGRTAKFNGPRNHHERDEAASAVRADHFMPPQCGIYYYEVQIISSKKDE
jgi:Ran-binding protein 9/10